MRVLCRGDSLSAVCANCNGYLAVIFLTKNTVYTKQIEKIYLAQENQKIIKIKIYIVIQY